MYKPRNSGEKGFSAAWQGLCTVQWSVTYTKRVHESRLICQYPSLSKHGAGDGTSCGAFAFPSSSESVGRDEHFSYGSTTPPYGSCPGVGRGKQKGKGPLQRAVRPVCAALSYRIPARRRYFRLGMSTCSSASATTSTGSALVPVIYPAVVRVVLGVSR